MTTTTRTKNHIGTVESRIPRPEAGVMRSQTRPSKNVYRKRRIAVGGAALLTSALAVGTGKNILEEAVDNNRDHTAEFIVDHEAVEHMPAEERDKKYASYVINWASEPEDLGEAPDLAGIAQEHKDTYELDVDWRNIQDALVEQNGGSTIVNNQDVFYLPRPEDK